MIEGISHGQISYAHGLDAFQALSLAIEGIYSALQASNRQLTWEGGELGETGFQRFVPQAFGLEFSRQINNMIDEKIQQFADKARERRKRGSPGAH